MDDQPTTSPQVARRDTGPGVGRLAARWRSPAAQARLATAGLWLLVAGALVAGGVALVRPRPSLTNHAEPAEPTVEAEGFAQLYVAAWLAAGRGDEDELRRFYPDVPTLSQLEPGARWAARTMTVAAEQVRARYWAITVAAEVFAVANRGFEPAGLHYYRVGVARGAAGLAATGLPAELPPPPTPEPAHTPVGSFERPRRGDPLTHAVERFVAALLAGTGELDRYVAPGVTLAPVSPPPFVAVELARVAADGAGGDAPVVVVVAEVIGTDPTGRHQVFHYPLELARRAGRWEVRRLLAALPLGDTALPQGDD